MIKVDNAIIMAAGMSSRFVPVSFELHKALISVNEEVLIERQIKQLHEAGINEVIIVTGYKGEQFEYLKEKFGVTLVQNDFYNERNNNYSLYLVKDYLKNSYICSSDNYFFENPFLDTEENAYYSCVYSDGYTDEWCVTFNENNRILDVEIGGQDSWIMLGHVLFDIDFSNKFIKILEKEVYKEENFEKLWEQLYVENIHDLELNIKKHNKNQIFEFDTLDELRLFDSSYIKKSGCTIMKDIASSLKVEEESLYNFIPIKIDNQTVGMKFASGLDEMYYNYETNLISLFMDREILEEFGGEIRNLYTKTFENAETLCLVSKLGGLTNHSFKVISNNEKYVFRLPGEGTKEILNRNVEKVATLHASTINIDSEVYYFNEQGEKVSRYIHDSETMNEEKLRSNQKITEVAEVLNTLHKSECKLDYNFRIFDVAKTYIHFIETKGIKLFDDFDEYTLKVKSIAKRFRVDDEQFTICHNDPLCENWIYGDEKLYLIDWEYAGMNDPMWDLADVSIEAQFNREEDTLLLNSYFGYILDKDDNAFLGMTANKILIDYLWSLWGLTRIPYGDSMLEYAELRYQRMKENCKVIEEKL